MTKAIRKLESETNARLFERTTRRVLLTEEGKAVFRRARAILDHADAISRDLDEVKNVVSGELRVGAMEVFSVRVLPRAIAALIGKFPAVVPLVYEMHPASIERYVSEGLLDVGFTIGPCSSREVASDVVGTSPGRIVCGRSHPLYTKPAITRATLSRYPFVVPRFFQREHLPSLDQFPDDVFPRKVGATIELLQMMIELVAAGKYLGYFPEVSVAHHMAARDLRALRGLPGLPQFELRVVTRKGVAPRRSVRALVHELGKTLRAASSRP
jgi:DNA-binding transcriptional LysR family regulator